MECVTCAEDNAGVWSGGDFHAWTNADKSRACIKLDVAIKFWNKYCWELIFISGNGKKTYWKYLHKTSSSQQTRSSSKSQEEQSYLKKYVIWRIGSWF